MQRRRLAVSRFVAHENGSVGCGLRLIYLMVHLSTISTIIVHGVDSVAILGSLLLLQFDGLTGVIYARLIALLQEILLPDLRWLLRLTLSTLLLLLLDLVLFILICFVKLVYSVCAACRFHDFFAFLDGLLGDLGRDFRGLILSATFLLIEIHLQVLLGFQLIGGSLLNWRLEPFKRLSLCKLFAQFLCTAVLEPSCTIVVHLIKDFIELHALVI